MDKKLLCLLLLAAAFIGQAQTAQAATVSKMPGTKNMRIYAKVTKKGASKKVTTTKYFKYSKIQPTASKKTKEGKFFPAAGKKPKNSLDRGKAFQ
ncbi:hypothetical protein [Lactobacillus delbrueckii]|uniref:hypothetical protein n=1 Tax=Lactobacillus delbrueckii TaxID=1584 RepID=UPI001F1F53EF|nr:hypothetical protein [Lactobacillus delbrueckii]GHN54476.1 hypothetical protein ME803_04250 [Lactobacillus delbrueckii]GHN58208.1 hypothetical protein ME805_04320 [Lactobacillus delbrueckii]